MKFKIIFIIIYYRLAGPHDQRPYRGKRHIGKSPLYLPRRFIKDAIL